MKFEIIGGHKTLTTIPNGGELYVRSKVDQGIKFGYSRCNCSPCHSTTNHNNPKSRHTTCVVYPFIFISLSSLLNIVACQAKDLIVVCMSVLMSLNPKTSSSQRRMSLKVKQGKAKVLSFHDVEWKPSLDVCGIYEFESHWCCHFLGQCPQRYYCTYQPLWSSFMKLIQSHRAITMSLPTLPCEPEPFDLKYLRHIKLDCIVVGLGRILAYAHSIVLQSVLSFP